MPFSRSTALVTGASQRLGRGIALALAQAGWQVGVHCNRSVQEAAQTVATIQAGGGNAALVQADLTLLPQVESLLERCEELLGPVTCLINNASRFEFDDARALDPEQLQAHWTVNLQAPLILAQRLFQTAQQRHPSPPQNPDQRCVIINLLDQKLGNPNPDFFSYTLSKAALATATGLLAQRYAPWVRVVGLSPGITLPSGGQSQANFERNHRQTPLGASSTVADIAAAVCYLLNAPAITGTILVVDGGQHLVPSARDVLFMDPEAV